MERLQAQGQYPRDLYEAFKSDRDEEGNLSRDKLISVLLEEQQNRCCYCMRQLDNNIDEITLEHLILNSITRHEEYDRYLEKETVLRHNVCLAKDFIDNNEQHVPPYPHTVAYQNLTASCNGRIVPGSKEVHCCNLKRCSDFIEPILLYETVHNEIRYKPNGTMLWVNECEESSKKMLVNILGLNDPVLRMIRRIWFYVKKEHINLFDVKRNNFIYKLMNSFSEEDFNNTQEIQMLLNFKNDTYWKLLEKYNYFGL